MEKIKIAVVGVGNCASSLIQGLSFYRDKKPEDAIGLMHWNIGGYCPSDIEVVAAFDIDQRKVGKEVSEAVFAPPNCTEIFCRDLQPSGVKVTMGAVLDGISPHMVDFDPKRTFIESSATESTPEDVVRILRQSNADMLLNYLPVGSEAATRFYAQCALDAGVGFINNIPVFIASDPVWSRKFEERGLLQ